MNAEALSSILEAELEVGEVLADTLDRQRRALIERDVDRITELSSILEVQMERLGSLVAARSASMADEDAQITDGDAALLQRIRRIEGRVLRLADLNQDLIADRLAYVGAMLSTIGLTGAAGYSRRSHAAAPPSAVSRSA